MTRDQYDLNRQWLRGEISTTEHDQWAGAEFASIRWDAAAPRKPWKLWSRETGRLIRAADTVQDLSAWMGRNRWGHGPSPELYARFAK